MFHRPNLETLESSLTIACPLSPVVRKLPNLVDSFLVDTVRIVHIHSVIILRRSDKRKDRVEISPEQLSAASTEAEISLLTGRVLYTCFQSIQAQKSSEYERIEIPIHIVPHVTIGKVCLESAVELPKILCQEEQDAYRRIHSLTHLDSVTKIHNGSGFPLAYGSRDVHDGLRIGIFAQPICLSSGRPYTTVCRSNLLRFSYFLLQPRLSVLTVGGPLVLACFLICVFPIEVFTKNLCSQMSAVSGPLLQWLEDRLEQNQQHLQELQQEKEELMRELSSLE
ncbi:Lys-63-specific deubiquitinase BRCC36 [Pteropus alecto]|uniref:Lys-63-specific deubiquitinase BRCC36 n=1 Tax=Pteropus alecto TaxID=9402 RepID=L5L2Q6_PTEAL|nr:Lys-63-specific deubiquitinase BRCC36 [Pteropus alecto]